MNEDGMEKSFVVSVGDSLFLSMLFAGILMLYVIGLDRGFLFSLVQGAAAFDMNLIHEFLHDARHSAGFPCH